VGLSGVASAGGVTDGVASAGGVTGGVASLGGDGQACHGGFGNRDCGDRGCGDLGGRDGFRVDRGCRDGFRVDRGCRDGFREDGRRWDERHLSNVRGRRSRVGGGQVGCRKCADAMSVGVGDGGHGADIGLGRVVAHDRPMEVARAAEVPGS